MKKTLLIVLICLAIAAIFGYNYIYQDHRDIKTEEANFKLESSAFLVEFEKDAEVAQKKYLNKSIELTGITTEVSISTITLNSIIFCTLNPNQSHQATLNKQTTIKGRFIGYDDLLEEIKLDQTTILNPLLHETPFTIINIFTLVCICAR